MADSKLADLTEEAAPDGADIIYVVTDPSGTPADRKAQLSAVRPGLDYDVGDQAGNHTTTSTSFTDVDAQYAVSIPAVAGDRLEIEFIATWWNSGASNDNYISCAVAGTDIAVVVIVKLQGSNEEHLCAYRTFHTVQAGDISAGTVAVKPRWKVTAGTGTIANESTSDRTPVFSVKNWRQ